MAPYEYEKSLKSSLSEELINTYLLRPIAGLIVRVLYPTRITPNQVTMAAIVAGLAAAGFYLQNEASFTAMAGLLVTLKDVLDSADGQLARAKQRYTRSGRFLDSIGDFVVDVAVFAAIGWVLYLNTGNGWMFALALAGLAGITLRVSYYVFYQTSFLHLEEKYEVNRVMEEITDADQAGDRTTLTLQRIFQMIYGWQDRSMARIDEWSRRGVSDQEFLIQWYSDPVGLRLSSLLGMATELFLLMLCSLFHALRTYLWLNLLLMNAVFAGSFIYRRWSLSKTISMKGQTCGNSL